jgi:two-component system response regulator (stage 0 sporulation protein F)
MSRRHILLVDDDAGFLTALTKMLAKQGYIVTSVSDASSAVDAMKNREQPFDLVITDLSMPMISGFTLLNAVKSAAPDVKVIVVTAVGEPDTRTKVLRDGAFGYFNKPLEREEFLGEVERAMKDKRPCAD